jgi:voltage-gated potassium channel
VISRRRHADLLRWRRRVCNILDGAGTSDRVALLVHSVLVVFVIVSVGAVVLESVPELARTQETLFIVIEIVAVTVFTIEYGLRLWSAPDHTAYADLPPWRARLKFVITASAIVDLLSVLPIYFALILPIDLKFLLLLRLAPLLQTRPLFPPACVRSPPCSRRSAKPCWRRASCCSAWCWWPLP